VHILKVTVSAAIAVFSLGAFAASNSTTCSDSYGMISVVDGNVTLKDGIGDVGLAKSQVVLKEVSEKTENCVEGPNYVWTKITVQEVKYDIEENVQESAVVLCTQVQTGIDNNCN
jgi:hypothetical protein